MVEAVQTTTSTFGIWAIIIVATLTLAFWLTAITLADRSQVRASGPRRAVGESGGAWLPQGEMPTRDDLPAQPAAEGQTLPPQRTGDSDRAARRYAGPDAPDDEETGGQAPQR